MKYWLINILLLFTLTRVWGQTNPLNGALDNYKTGNLVQAKAIIDSLLTDTAAYESQPVAYYIKGFIYKDLFKADTSTTKEMLRSEAVAAFRKTKTLDLEGLYEQEVDQNLKYLATTYYNDAMNLIDDNDFNKAVQFYNHFEMVSKNLNDSTFTRLDTEKQFYLALGSAYVRYDQQDTINDYFEPAAKAFKRVLEIDSLNQGANYNLGALYYNEAVNRILGLGYDEVDLMSFSEFEDETIALFKNSLPFMNKAYKINPKDENVLEGLSGIYFGLRNFEMSDRFKEELAAVGDN